MRINIEQIHCKHWGLWRIWWIPVNICLTNYSINRMKMKLFSIVCGGLDSASWSIIGAYVQLLCFNVVGLISSSSNIMLVTHATIASYMWSNHVWRMSSSYMYCTQGSLCAYLVTAWRNGSQILVIHQGNGLNPLQMWRPLINVMRALDPCISGPWFDNEAYEVDVI